MRIYDHDKETEGMSMAIREKYYFDKLKEIINYAYRNAPAIRRKFDQAGFDPSQFKNIQDLEKVPILKKEELKEEQRKNPPFGGYLAIPLENLQRVYVSPGPIYDPEEKGASRLREAKMMYDVGFRPGDRVAVTLSYHMVPAGLLFDKALREIGALVVPTGVGNSELQVRVIKDLHVTGYVGTATFLMSLIRKAEERGYIIRQEFPIKKALLTAEMVPQSLRDTLEYRYHIDTWQAYGTADVGLFACECDQKSGMHLANDVYVEIIDPSTGKNVQPGETGEVVVTYFNKVYPLIRLATGDLSYLNAELCPCGRTSPRLVKILGRVGDAFKVRGLFLHGSQVKEALSIFSEISRYSMEISRTGDRDQLTLKAELKYEGVDQENLSFRLLNRIKDVCRLKVDEVKFVRPGTLEPDVKPLIDNRKWE